jgi:hypothetical protein
MIITITNQLATTLDIGFPLNVTLGANGGGSDSFTGGVSLQDLTEGNEKGDSAYKRLNLLKQNGSITMSIAVDPNDTDLLDQANELGVGPTGQTGPTGPTGAQGQTGPTGPSGP